MVSQAECMKMGLEEAGREHYIIDPAIKYLNLVTVHKRPWGV
jgi:hypothetical protein